MLSEPLLYRGVGLGLVMPFSQFHPKVAVGLLASVWVLYARNLYDMISYIDIRKGGTCRSGPSDIS